MRYFTKIFLVLSFLAGVAACSNYTGDGNAVSDKVDRMTIDIWSPKQSSKANELMLKQVKAFNDNQRNIRVELALFEAADYAQIVEKALNEKNLPAMISLDLDQLALFTEADLLQPLDKMMSQRLWQDLLPDILEQGHIGTHLYGVPTVHKADKEYLWGVLQETEDKAATMAFIHYLLHPNQQRLAVEIGYTEPVTYSAMSQ
ncbi:MAG: extracellular solute-binding protein [Thiotrichales bacterium]|nr:extracellular solute-binding protein [Thiotrichales bacterium]